MERKRSAGHSLARFTRDTKPAKVAPPVIRTSVLRKPAALSSLSIALASLEVELVFADAARAHCSRDLGRMADVDQNTEPAAVAFFLSRVLSRRGFCGSGKKPVGRASAQAMMPNVAKPPTSLIGEGILVGWMPVV